MTLFLMMTSACLVSGMGIMLAPIMLGLMTLLYAVKDRNRENIKMSSDMLPAECYLCGGICDHTLEERVES